MNRSTVELVSPESEHPDQESEENEVAKKLKEAGRDLKHAEVPIVGLVAYPVYHKILAPSVDYASRVVPSIVEPIPGGKETASFLLDTFVAAAKQTYRLGHRLLPYSKVENIGYHECEQDLDSVDITELTPDQRKGLISNLTAAAGFAATTALDLVAIISNPDKYYNWVGTVDRFLKFIYVNGIDRELKDAFATPRIYHNLLIAARIQKMFEHKYCNCSNRRALAALTEKPLPTEDLDEMMKWAPKFMRYCTAAYGVSMIESAKTYNVATNSITDFYSDVQRKIFKDKVEDYVNAKVVYMTPPGANEAMVGHFVAIDKKANAVVLAIRGTYSISGLLADAEAYTREFCGGVAHAGIADRAMNLWVEPYHQPHCSERFTGARKAIAEALRNHPDFELVLCGHSLGAGVACLLNIKLHHDGLDKLAQEIGINDVRVRCVAVASPPVFCKNKNDPQVDRVDEAIKNTVCYMHQDDCVPFLSAHVIRRLADTLKKVDGYTADMAQVSRLMVSRGIMKAPAILWGIVWDGSKFLEEKESADSLSIPAQSVLWFQRSGKENRPDAPEKKLPMYDGWYCDPQKLKVLSFYMSPDMITDHLMPAYERATYSVAEQRKYGEPALFP